MNKPYSTTVGAIAIALFASKSGALDIVSGSELSGVTVGGTQYDFLDSGPDASLGTDILYDFWAANPGSTARVLGYDIKVSGDINLDSDGGRSLELLTGDTYSIAINSTITGSSLANGEDALSIGADFINSTGDTVLALIGYPGNQHGRIQEVGSLNVNANLLKINDGSSITLGEGDTLKFARSWFDPDTGEYIAELPDNSLFQNNGGRIEQLGQNSSVDIRGIFQNYGQYVLQGGRLNIKNDAYFQYSSTFDQAAGTSVSVDGAMLIDSGSTYNMTGGSLIADWVTAYTQSGTYTFDSSGNEVLVKFDVGATDGRFNYADGAVQLKQQDMYIRDGGLIGQDVVIESGESYGAYNMYVGTLDDNITDFNNTGIGATASGSIVMNGGLNTVVRNMVIGQSASVTQNSGFNQVGADLFIDGGDLTQNDGSNRIDGRLLIGDGGQYTLNGGNLTVGSIDTTPYFNGSGGYEQGRPLMTSNGGFNYVNGGLRLSDSDLTVWQNGLLGDSVLIDDANEIFGAVNMTIGREDSFGNSFAGAVTQSTGVNTVEGQLTVAVPGQYDLSGGRLEIGSFAGPGTINFTGGQVYLDSDTGIGSDGPFGSTLLLDTNKTLSLSTYAYGGTRHALSIDSGADLTLDGGDLIASEVANNGGHFNYVSGRLDVESLTFGTGGPLGSFTVDRNHELYVQNDLTIDSGTTVTIHNSSIYGGATITNNGLLRLDGGSLYASQINNIGSGQFEFANGSLSLDTLDVGASGLLGSTVVLDSSRSISAGTVNVGAGSHLEVNGGSSSATNLTNDGVVVVAQAGRLTGETYTQNNAAATTTVDGSLNANVQISDGQLNGSGTINGNAVNEGSFNPGNSPGELLISGDFAQTAPGVLNIEIGGLLPGEEYDVLNITGNADLGGTLDVGLYDLGGSPFKPSLGDTFDFLKAESITGSFDFLALASLGDGLGWRLDYLTDEIGTTDVARLSVTGISAVPAPATVWLFGSGLFGLVGAARRKAA